jgi:uncharacterized protein (DUF111 family)
MARILYLDCFSGIAGDMVLGALLDAGLPFDDLKRALGSLAISGYEVTTERVLRAGVSATKFRVIEQREHPAPSTTHHAPSTQHTAGEATQHPAGEATQHPAGETAQHPAEATRHPAGETTQHPAGAAHHHHPHRHLKSIYELIDRSGLSPAGRTRAKELFQRLGEAEAAIHQTSIEKVHLHEVGALDSIIDIVGAVFALEWVGADRIVRSLNVGGVQSAHGLFPVPAPATLKLLGDTPYSGLIRKSWSRRPALIATTAPRRSDRFPR